MPISKIGGGVAFVAVSQSKRGVASMQVILSEAKFQDSITSTVQYFF